jgi:thiol-disulfide isomerase/thioredoxin
MDDIHVFIILFLALIFLCRLTKEGFESMGPGGVLLEGMDEPVVEPEEDMDTPPPPPPPVPQDPGTPPMPPPPQGNMEQPEGGMMGWDKRKVFSSPSASNFGSILELQEIEYLNSLFSKRNADHNVPDVPIDSQMPSLSEGSTVPNLLGNSGSPSPPQKQGGEPLEVHMVYAEWCGHSQNALEPFKELVDMTDIVASSGKPVKFVLTEQSSDGFKEFKGKVKGFPTYMLKDGSNLEEIDVGDRSKDSILTAVEKL